MTIEQEIIDTWFKIKRISKVAKIHHKNWYFVKNILNQYNIDTNYQKFRKVNDSFFMNFSNELFYFLGFCLADGNLMPVNYKSSGKRNKLSLSLHINDLHVLNMFQKWISCNPPKLNNNVGKLQISLDCKINLTKYGIVPNKTYNPIEPIIPKQFIKAFLFGILDGDGTVRFEKSKGYRIGLVCNTLIVNWFISTIKELGYNGKILIENDSNEIWSRISINNRNDVINLYKILYCEDYYFIMNRKWDNIKTYINNFNPKIKTCKKCNQSFDLSYFYKRSDNNSYRSFCKNCMNKRN